MLNSCGSLYRAVLALFQIYWFCEYLNWLVQLKRQNTIKACIQNYLKEILSDCKVYYDTKLQDPTFSESIFQL